MNKTPWIQGWPRLDQALEKPRVGGQTPPEPTYADGETLHDGLRELRRGQLTSNPGRGSKEKAVGGLGEAMAVGLSRELRGDLQSCKGRASLGRGPLQPGCTPGGACLESMVRESQEEMGLEGERGPHQGVPGRLRLKCAVLGEET